MNVYYDPEEFGLKIVAKIEWDDEPHSYNLTVV